MFDFDKTDITPLAASTLRRNADSLLAHPNVHIVIDGYASEDENNIPLSGRRAKAAFDYLKSLGVPEQQMRYRSLGVSTGRLYLLHRSVYFEIESEK
jgi:outer membrane protein OmpA-like peptidoglycan-associated protein